MARLTLLALLVACARPPEGGSPAAPVAGDADLGDGLLVVVGEVVTLDAGASVGTALAWDFGDGAVAEGRSVSHAWAEAGHYLVTLTADGAPPDLDSLVVVVVNPPLADPPTASGKLVSDGSRLYAALPDFDQVAVVDVSGGVTRLDVCDRPTSLSAGATGLAVACRDGAQVYDAGLQLVEERVGEAAAVLLDDGLWVLRPDGLLEGPGGEARALAGRALVGWEGTVATAAFKSPADHALWWDGRGPEGGAWRIERDPGPDSDTDARGVANLLGAGAVRPDGGTIVWGGLKSNTERGLYVEGTALEPDNVVRAVLKVLDPATGEALEQPLFDNRDLVGAVAFTPLGDELVVAHHGSRIVDVLDGYTMQRVGGFQDVGDGLDGAWTDGETAWILASLDRQLVGYDLTAGNAQVEVARIDLVAEEVLPADVVEGAKLFHRSADPRMSVDAYISCGSCHPDGGEDGRVWDFTQRGEGLRNTLPIFGLPLDGPFHWSANFDELQDFENDIRLHQGGLGFLADEDWLATQDPLGAPKAGLSAELDALAAYMRHVADERVAGTGDDTAFVAAGCAGCHAGPRSTDAAWLGDGEPLLHDVGTLTEASGQRMGAALTGLRTPSLLGVASTGPWLHDGSAATLEEAVLAHQVVGEAELDAIMGYLLEL